MITQLRGKILEKNKLNSYNYSAIIDSLTTKEIPVNCRKLAEEVFSLENGLNNYRKIYLEHT
jgi:hypothetical protein